MGFVLSIGKWLTKLMEWLTMKLEPQNSTGQTGGSANSEPRLQKIIMTVAGYAIAVIMGVAWFNYTDTKDRLKDIESKVSFLYQDKVSRAEFREEMTQVRLQIEATKSDIVARQDSMKFDILGRLDLMMNKAK